MNSENRRHRRVRSDFLVRARVGPGDPGRSGRCRNLSLGGAFIEWSHLPPKGSVLHLLLELAVIGRTIAVQAEVVWRRPEMPDRQFPPGAGVKFLALNDEDRGLIQDALELLEAQPP